VHVLRAYCELLLAGSFITGDCWFFGLLGCILFTVFFLAICLFELSLDRIRGVSSTNITVLVVNLNVCIFACVKVYGLDDASSGSSSRQSIDEYNPK